MHANLRHRWRMSTKLGTREASVPFSSAPISHVTKPSTFPPWISDSLRPHETIPSSKIIHVFVPRTTQSLQPESMVSSAGPGAQTTLPPPKQLGLQSWQLAGWQGEGLTGMGDFSVLQTACKQEAEAVEVIIV